ncbi:MAG: hypothetical protein KBS75_02205 [Bacteroidales bacterium]|nr:hypothetical protein [Candidatus Equimonas faecalis]
MKKYISPTADYVCMSVEHMLANSNPYEEVPIGGSGWDKPFDTRSQDDWSSDWTDTDE